MSASEPDAKAPDVAGDAYEVGDDAGFAAAKAAIETSDAAEAIIEFTADNVNVGGFAGVAGKRVTLRSAEGQKFTLAGMGTDLVGDLTLDNVRCWGVNTKVFANGHRFETTEGFSALPNATYGDIVGTLCGGGSRGNDVAGDTNLVLRGGKFGSVYGGGLDSNVGGDVWVLIDYPDPDAGNSTNLHGGGCATNTEAGQVSGDVHVDFVSGTLGVLYGGGQNNSGQIALRDTAARVWGDTFVTVGSSGFAADAKRAFIVSVEMYGGSDYSTVENTHITIENGAYICEKGDPYQTKQVYGAGWNDVVRGTTEITVNGGVMGAIYGGGTGYYDQVEKTLVANDEGAENATHIVLNGGTFEYVYPYCALVANSGTWDESTLPTIAGNALIEFNGGLSVDKFVLGDSNTRIEGDATLIVRGGIVEGVPQAYGWDEPDHEYLEGEAKLVFDGCGGEGGGLFEFARICEFEDVSLVNGARVAMPFLDLGDELPAFRNIGNLSIESGCTLALDGPARIEGDLLVDGGTLALARESHEPFDPEVPALLTVGGTAKGSARLLTCSTENWLDTTEDWLDGTCDDNLIPASTPLVGEIYVSAQKTGSDDPFVLENASFDPAEPGAAPELYVNRIDQPDAADSRYAWQIAAKRTVTFDENGGDTKADPPVCDIPLVAGQTEYHATLPATEPTRVGYDFAGWSAEVDDPALAHEFTAASQVDRSMTVYAQWKARSDTAFRVEHYQVSVDGASARLVRAEDNVGATGAEAVARPISIPGCTYRPAFDQTA